VIESYLAALEERHLANLTRAELTRALRALSSCYVERRDKLAGGAALEGAGKRAAFALFYGPLHFLTIDAIVRELSAEQRRISTIHDIGCGTGVGGAAWALAAGGETRDAGRGVRVEGIDRSAWAVAEANWTYRQLGVNGRAAAGDAVAKFPDSQISRFPNSAVLLAYSANEIPEPARSRLLDKVEAAVTRGCSLLIVEPIAKKDRGWWPVWAGRLAPAGVVEREWRFPANLPASLRQLAKSAGLDPRELTARTLSG
jgi:hypothetical protein